MARFSLQGGLDGWIRGRGITHPLIVPILRNQLLILLVLFFAASAFATESLMGVWFCAGFAIITFVLYSWAQFFSKVNLGTYSNAFLRVVLLRFTLRLLVLAFAIYGLIVLAHASPMLLLAGVAVGTFAPLLTWALKKSN